MFLTHKKGQGASLLALMLASMAPGALHAQTTPPATGAADAASSQPRSTADDIVVTAQRQSQNVQKVPIAVTAVSQETIQNLNIRNVDKIATVTTGLIYDTGYSFVQTYIRGIGVSNSPGVGLESPVAIYIDGAYMPRGTGTIFDLVDVGSIEVLKGPQGTLYGHNASGGAILIRSANPTNNFEGSVTGEYGRFDHVMLDGMINLPVSETLSVRVAGRYRDDGGFLDNLTTGQKVRGKESTDGRIKLKWEPSSDFTAIAALDYHWEKGSSNASGGQGAGLPFCVGCIFGATPEIAGPYEVTEDFKRSDIARSWNGNLKLQYDFGGVTLESVTNYRDLYGYISDDSDRTSAPLFAFDALYGGKTFSQDLQLSSAFDGVFNFLAGVQYINDKAYQRSLIYGDLFGLPYDNSQTAREQRNAPDDRIEGNQRVTTNSYAAFAEVYIKPTDHLTITLGGRYSKDRRRVSTVLNPIAQGIFNPSGTAAFSQRDSWNKFTPRAVVAYDFGIVNVYASYTKGFKSGGFNVPSFAPQADPINPETIDSYEIGAKFVSDDRRTRLNFAAFRYDYNDAQVSIIDATGASQIILNAASARGKGFELDGSHRFAEFLTLSGGLSYLDAQYRSYPNAAVYKYVRDAGGAIVGLATGEEDLSGTRMPRSPKWSGFVQASLEVPVSSDWIARLNTVAHFTTGYLFQPGAGGDLRSDRQGGYTTVNMSGAIGPVSGKYEVGFYVDNLTDTKYYNTIAVGSLGVSELIAAPVTYGLRVKARF